MARQRKEKLKKRKDGRYRTIYKGISFYSNISSDDAIAKREAYKIVEKEMVVKVQETTTIEEFAKRWIKTAKTGDLYQTIKEAQIHLNKLVDQLGYMQLRDVKPSDIKEVYSEQYTDNSTSYIQAASQLYKAFFDAAVENNYCKFNPARMKSAKPHRGTSSERRPITPQEREWIMNYCTDHRAHPAVIAMLYAGLRPPEAKALNIDDSFDQANMMLHIKSFVHVSSSNQYEITDKGKTKKSTRDIPVFPPLYNVLKDKHGMLIPSASGKPVTIQAWRTVWESYVHSMETAINGCQKRWYGKTKKHKALLAEGKELPPWISFDIVPYQLRKSFCVFCRDNGVELNTCVYWMGHADAKMILKVYDSVSYERSVKEAEKLNMDYFQVQKRFKNNTTTNETVDN